MRIWPVVLLTLLPGAAPGVQDSPRPKDRTVAQWLKDLESDSPKTRLTACQALGHFDAASQAAVRQLEWALLRDKDDDVRAAAATALGRMGLVASEALPALKVATRDSEYLVRFAAVRALGKLGQNAWPPLLDLLGHAELGSAAKDALSELGPQAKTAAPLLIARLGHKEENVRLGVKSILEKLAKDVVRELVQGLEQKDDGVRCWVAQTLGQLRADGQLAVPALQKALKDPSLAVRLTVAEAIVEIDVTKAADTVPILIEALQSEDKLQQQRVAGLVEKIGPEAARIAPGLLPLLSANDATAIRALDSLGKAALPPLLEALATGPVRHRPQAVVALAWLKTELPQSALPAVLKVLPELDKTERIDGRLTLKAFGPDAAGELAKALKHANPQVRHDVAIVLGQWGPPAKAAAAALSNALGDNDPAVRMASATALVEVVPSLAPQAATVWIALLREGEIAERRHAAKTLGELKLAARLSGPTLAKALRDPDPDVQLDALDALKALGSEAGPALPRLLAFFRQSGVPSLLAEQALLAFGQDAAGGLAFFLEDDDDRLRLRTVRVLGKLGPAARDHVPELIHALPDSQGELGAAVGDALRAIGKPPAGAVPALTALVADGNPLQRQHAASALGQLGKDGKAASATLVAALRKDDDEKVRERAAFALGEIGGAAEPLIAALQDRSAAVRTRAALALPRIGKLEKNALAALVPALAAPEYEVRERALQILQEHGADAGPALVDGLEHPSQAVRQKVIKALGRLQLKAPEVVRCLTQLALDPQSDALRPAVIDALSQLRVATPEVLQCVAQLILNAKHGEAAANRFFDLTPDRALLVPPLVGALKKADAAAMPRLRNLFANMGTMPVPALRELLRDADRPVRVRAASVLVDLVMRSKVNEATIRDDPGICLLALESDDQATRERALQSLVQSSIAPSMVPQLNSALKDPSARIRTGAAELLGRLGPQAAAALPALAELAKDPNARQQAIRTMGLIGREAVPYLKLWLRNADDSRRHAAEALGSMGPSARDAVPELVAALQRDSEGKVIRDYVANALVQIDADAARRVGLLPSPPVWPFYAGATAGAGGLLYVGFRLLRRHRQRRHREKTRREQLARFLKHGAAEKALDVLELHPEATPQQQLQLLLMDQGHHWRQGEPRPVREYLDRWKPLAAQADLLIELIVGDILCARRSGQPIDPRPYLQQFPAIADRLEHRMREVATTGAVAPSSVGSESSAGRAGQALPPTIDQPETQDTGRPAPAEEPVWALTIDQAPAASCYERSSVPAQIGRYAIECVLGEGAFGTVYLARDDELRRQVAIKVPRRARMAAGAALDAYLAEARVVAGLDHPAIVPVYDVGRTSDGLLYVVSKLIPGTNLAKRLHKGRPSIEETVTLLIRVAEALAHAHAKGLVHRDIKPANLLVDVLGNIYVADFGLALTHEDERDSHLVGTPAYMSPEQAAGQVVDARSDLFSLGIVFYEMLTGERPFQGATQEAVLQAIRQDRPQPPASVYLPTPTELNKLCLRCLAKDPVQRPRSADELAQALRSWQQKAGGANLDLRAERAAPERGRPFEAKDAALYLELLSGSRELGDVPLLLQSWKETIEQPQRPAVALLTGPLGSGKSSFVQAGLVPRLNERIQAVIVRLPDQGAEAAVLQAVRAAFPQVGAEPDLAVALEQVRDHEDWRRGKKVLLVLDQFERALYQFEGPDNATFGRPLEMCDGARLQMLLVARDEFAGVAGAFLRHHCIDVAQSVKPGAVEPFSPEQAHSVLLRMGQMLRRLPAHLLDAGSVQRQFLQQAVDCLTEAGRVSPLRLGQFFRLMRKLPWSATTLSQVGGLGGASGLPAALLEQCFHSTETAAETKRHSAAARRMLKLLLPPHDHEVDNHRCSKAEMCEEAGYSGRPQDFAALMMILAEELRLVRPVPPESAGAAPRWQLAGDRLVVGVERWVRQGAKSRRRQRDADEVSRLLAAASARPRHVVFGDAWARVGYFQRLGCALVVVGLPLLMIFGVPALGGWSALLDYWFAAVGLCLLVGALVFGRRLEREPDQTEDDEVLGGALTATGADGQGRQRRDGPTRKSLRGGLSLVRLGLGFHLVRLALQVLTIIACVGVTLVVAGGDGPNRSSQGALRAVAIIVMGVLLVVQPLLGLVGSSLCLFVPRASGTRGLVLTSLLLDVGGTATGVLLSLINVAPYLPEWLAAAARAPGVVAASFGLLAWVFFMNFLCYLADYLDDQDLAGQAVRLVRVGVALLIGPPLVAWLVDQVFKPQVGLAVLLIGLVLWMGGLVVFFVNFSVLVALLRAAILAALREAADSD